MTKRTKAFNGFFMVAAFLSLVTTLGTGCGGGGSGGGGGAEASPPQDPEDSGEVDGWHDPDLSTKPDQAPPPRE